VDTDRRRREAGGGPVTARQSRDGFRRARRGVGALVFGSNATSARGRTRARPR
jgi:hypothetical protein